MMEDRVVLILEPYDSHKHCVHQGNPAFGWMVRPKVNWCFQINFLYISSAVAICVWLIDHLRDERSSIFGARKIYSVSEKLDLLSVRKQFPRLMLACQQIEKIGRIDLLRCLQFPLAGLSANQDD